MRESRAQLNPAWPEVLAQADFARLKFSLDFTSACSLQPAVFLGLGRLLRFAARQGAGRRHGLVNTALSGDPFALRRHQKPSPAFVVRMPLTQKLQVDSGDCLELEVLFLGSGLTSIHDFLNSLVHLGQLGLVNGDGRFEVSQALSVGPDNREEVAWRQTAPVSSLTPMVVSLGWWLETQLPQATPLVLKFLTPTRLLADGKPLRKPSFAQVFPFMLRRVTSMLHACCNLEPVEEPRRLLALAAHVDELGRELAWRDWRPLTGRGQAVGGFVGSMILSGDELEELFWILATAMLFGIGKSASHGAGGLELCSGELLPAGKCAL